MKKILGVFLLIGVLMLSGCQVPFMKSGNSKVEKYVDASALVMKSSRDIDESLVRVLMNAEKDKLNEKEILNSIVNARNMQKELHTRLTAEKSLYENERIKEQYLLAIDDKQSSYNTLINGINGTNYKYIEELTRLHVAKTRNLEDKVLKEINYVLTLLGKDKRFTLMPNEKTLCAKVKEEKKKKKKDKKNDKEATCLTDEQALKFVENERKPIDDLLKAKK